MGSRVIDAPVAEGQVAPPSYTTRSSSPKVFSITTSSPEFESWNPEYT